MKKIGLITYHNPCNYGATLQAYATVKFFEELGFETLVINYVPSSMRNFGKLSKTVNDINGNIIKKISVGCIKNFSYKRMKKLFDKYSNALLPLSEVYPDYQSLVDNPPNVDIYCTGSDQVWNNHYTKVFERAFFLDFISEKKSCFSFAASFGKKSFSDDENEQLKKMLSKYEFISVREKDGLNILKNLGFSNSKQIFDPTLMVNYDVWKNLASKNISNNKEKYILVYQLHGDSEAYKLAKRYSKKKNIKIIKINTMYHQYKIGCTNKLLPTIQDFLAYIRDAEYVFTDSFHGVVFSLIFKRKIGIYLPNNFSNRITSLLDIVDGKNYIIKTLEEWENNIKKINSDKVFDKLIICRNQKFEMFSDYLKCK